MFSNEFIVDLLKMLAQKYTYSNPNIWLNVSWPFSPQFCAFDIRPQASGRPLAEFGVLAWAVIFMGFKSGLGNTIPKPQFSLIQPFLYHFLCVFGITALSKHPTAPTTRSCG